MEVRRSRGRWLVRFGPLLAFAIASQLAVSGAQANHIRGATYTGTHSGGGTVEFTVSADGTRIESFRLTNVPSGSCTLSEVRSRAGTTIPIAADHTFAFEEGGALGSFFRGAFSSGGNASGTLKATPIPAQLACLTQASQTWTARTASASPPASPQPQPTTGAAPYFRNAQNVKLVRGGTGVSVRAWLQICEGTPPLRLVVRQRRRVGSSIVAEARLQPRLKAGRATASGCRVYTSTWKLTSKFFGSGFVVVTLRIVDAAGQESGAPQFAMRAPKR